MSVEAMKCEANDSNEDFLQILPANGMSKTSDEGTDLHQESSQNLDSACFDSADSGYEEFLQFLRSPAKTDRAPSNMQGCSTISRDLSKSDTFSAVKATDNSPYYVPTNHRQNMGITELHVTLKEQDETGEVCRRFRTETDETRVDRTKAIDKALILDRENHREDTMDHPPISSIYCARANSKSDSDLIGMLSRSLQSNSDTYSDLDSVKAEHFRPPSPAEEFSKPSLEFHESVITPQEVIEIVKEMLPKFPNFMLGIRGHYFFTEAISLMLVFQIYKSLHRYGFEHSTCFIIGMALYSLSCHLCGYNYKAPLTIDKCNGKKMIPVHQTYNHQLHNVHRPMTRDAFASRGRGYGPPLDNISQTIGNTPMVKISDRLCPEGRTIYAKCEFFNPLSSVKDRMALSIIQTAERDGTLKPGQTVIEATSGNTGIAVAMMCAQRGYPCVITMAENFSLERRKIMRMLGAKVILTPSTGRGTGMVEKAKELADKHGWFLCHQFETDANWKFHYETTGPEICNDLKGLKLDYWVTGYGTGGTFHGAGKYIKENSPNTKIVLAELEAAKMVGSGIPTERHSDGSPAASHPAFTPHPVQGWAPDFIAQVLEKGLEQGIQDEIIEIPNGASINMSQALAKSEGILTGISGGATMWAAIETAKKAPEGSVIVCMLPDTGERYLSTPLFANILDEMNAEEIAIARTTPSWVVRPQL